MVCSPRTRVSNKCRSDSAKRFVFLTAAVAWLLLQRAIIRAGGSLAEAIESARLVGQGGHTLTEIAIMVGRSTSFVFARLNEPGRELAERTGLESGYEI
jgi:hypothetical protein